MAGLVMTKVRLIDFVGAALEETVGPRRQGGAAINGGA